MNSGFSRATSSPAFGTRTSLSWKLVCPWWVCREHLCIFLICLTFLLRCLSGSLAHFLIRLFAFLLRNVKRLSWYWTTLLHQMMLLPIFPTSLCTSPCLDKVCKAQARNLPEVQLMYYLFRIHAFGVASSFLIHLITALIILGSQSKIRGPYLD